MKNTHKENALSNCCEIKTSTLCLEQSIIKKKKTTKQRKREPISAPGVYVLNFEKLDREAIPQETFEQLIPILNIFLAITNIWCREEPVSLPET